MSDCDLDNACIWCIEIFCIRPCNLYNRCIQWCQRWCGCISMKKCFAGFSIVTLLLVMTIALILGIGFSNTASVPLADLRCTEICGNEYSSFDSQTCCLTSTPSACKLKEICREQMDKDAYTCFLTAQIAGGIVFFILVIFIIVYFHKKSKLADQYALYP